MWANMFYQRGKRLESHTLLYLLVMMSLYLLLEVCCRKWSKSSVQYKKGRSTDESGNRQLVLLCRLSEYGLHNSPYEQPADACHRKKNLVSFICTLNRRKGPEMRKRPDRHDLEYDGVVAGRSGAARRRKVALFCLWLSKRPSMAVCPFPVDFSGARGAVQSL